MKPDAPIEFVGLDECHRAQAGEPITMRAELRRPAHLPGRAIVRAVRAGPGIAVEIDPPPSGVSLGPGDAHTVLMRVTFPRPDRFRIEYIVAEVEGHKELIKLENLAAPSVEVGGQLLANVEVSVERVCPYGDDTRVVVVVKHKGDEVIRDFSVSVGPAEVVRGGGCGFRRSAFGPNDTDVIRCVVAGSEVEICLAGRIGDALTESVVRRTVPSERDRPRPAAFRFLEPRRLTQDKVGVRLLDDPNSKGAAKRHGAFRVQGRERYAVTIRPADPAATAVILRESPEQVSVDPAPSAGAGAWEFHVTVVQNEFWTRPARLYYDIESPDGGSRGEIHLLVAPPFCRRLKTAAQFGLLSTIGGFTSIVSAANDPESAWADVLSDSLSLNSIEFWKLFSIPVLWVGIRAIDRVQSWFRR